MISARLFRVPQSMLPEVRDCAADFGTTEAALFGAAIPIRGVAGDQQAATDRTGLLHARHDEIDLRHGLLRGAQHRRRAGATRRTACCRPSPSASTARRTYALEGSIFVAGAAVQWLRDGLEGAWVSRRDRARSPPPPIAAQDVYLVPGFVGLGAPHWEPRARGALFGLTRATGPGRARAGGARSRSRFQTRDLLEAMRGDWPACDDVVLRVDGGMVASDWTMQFLADMLAARVDRPTMLETTALGAAWLAGHKAGVLPDRAGFQKTWKLDRSFLPAMQETDRARRYRGWRSAVAATLAHASVA